MTTVPLGRMSTALLITVSVAGLLMMGWPFVIPAQSNGQVQAPFVFIVLLAFLVVLLMAQLSDGGMDAKALAVLGVLSAVNAALRPLGAGTNGVETTFFLLILAGRVFGPGFGFALGCTSVFASALLTAGVGPWMPFQMLVFAWIGMGAGLLPRRLFGKTIRGRGEMVLLVGYGIVVAYVFGTLMNLWFWPFVAGTGTSAQASVSYIPGGPVGENLLRFATYTLISSTAVWDTGRAITNTVLLSFLGAPVLTVLRRCAHRARFGLDLATRSFTFSSTNGESLSRISPCGRLT